MKIDVKFTEETFPVKFDDGEKFKANFGNLLEIKDGYTQAELDKAVADATAAAYTDGQQAEYDRFWDAYQFNGNRMIHNYAFAGNGWREKTFKPKYSMKPSAASYMFAAFDNDADSPLNLVETLAQQNVSIDFSKCTNMAYCFYQALISIVGTIDLSSAADVTSVFNSVHLKTIENMIPPSIEMKQTCFQTGLTNLTIGGTITKNMNLSRCGLLTDASVQSVIDHLADLTGQTAQTITFHSSIVPKLTDEQIANILAKNWTM